MRFFSLFSLACTVWFISFDGDGIASLKAQQPGFSFALPGSSQAPYQGSFNDQGGGDEDVLVIEFDPPEGGSFGGGGLGGGGFGLDQAPLASASDNPLLPC
ncbi:MAG: hypothetical protein ACPGUZ_00655 [Holosporaceae bacterium]